jgi:hypothetical protein
LSQWATRITIRAPDQQREVEQRIEPSARRQIKSDHVGEDDDVEKRDLALERTEALLQEDPTADGLHLSGVHQPPQFP